MRLAPVVPRAAQRLGVIAASCESRLAWEAFERRALSDIDCTRDRLSLVIRELAAARGGDVLAAFSCSGRTRIRCTAEVARSRESTTGAPGAAKRAPGPDGVLGNAIQVAFEPAEAARPIPSRPRPAGVRELPALPASHRVLGTLATSCGAECPELAVRDALLLAAARLGFEDVVGVRCLRRAERYRCTAQGAVAESRVHAAR
ncbi:MAG: hypothetical protein DIU78_001170 [Pseudomonadota bacterium]